MNNSTPYTEALQAFLQSGHGCTSESLNNGLINQSYKITNDKTGHSYLLQRINQQIFPQPEKLQSNYQLIWQYLEDEDIPYMIPHPQFFPGPTGIYCDSKKNYWRIFDFVNESTTIPTAETTMQANEVASSFAMLTASLQHFDHRQLHITIPGFHDVAARFNQFRQSLPKAAPDRKSKAAPMIVELVSKEKYVRFFETFRQSRQFYKRVMHHDAKISNVLFDTERQHVICPVDFDTVMPGYFFSDFGDMVRSMVCPVNESNASTGDIHVRKEFYESLLDGYMSNMDHLLSKEEKEHIHCAGLLMTYMQALRFLSDYLNGDIYYRTEHPEQNFERALNQSTLLKKLESFLDDHYNYSLR